MESPFTEMQEWNQHLDRVIQDLRDRLTLSQELNKLQNDQLAHMRKSLPYSGITPSQQERLAIFCEEVGEALQVVGKIERHGWDSSSPSKPERTNRTDMEMEVGDILLAIDRLVQAGDISRQGLEAAMERKKAKNQYLHHQ